MLLDVIVLAEEHFHRGQQFSLHRLRLFLGARRELILHLQDLSARDLVDPLLIHLQRAQLFGDVDRIASRNEIGRRALQHRHVRRVVGYGRHQRRRRGARPDDEHPLALVVEIFRPGLWVNDLALERVHARPLGRVPFRVPVIALTHPQEAGRHRQHRAVRLALDLKGPEIVLARPLGAFDRMAITYVLAETVVVDHLVHVFQDLGRRRDRRTNPRLEAIAERVQVAVRTDARILVRDPRAAEHLLRLQRHERRARRLRLQVIGRSDARNPSAHDQDVEVLNLGGGFWGWGAHAVVSQYMFCSSHQTASESATP